MKVALLARVIPFHAWLVPYSVQVEHFLMSGVLVEQVMNVRPIQPSVKCCVTRHSKFGVQQVSLMVAVGTSVS